jgi:putative ABC transport system ATP-binding protein
MNAIRFQGVSKSRGSARRSVRVIRDVSFSINAGEVVLVVGPSGSGKTTLLGLAAGLLTADDGEVEVRGVRIDQATPGERRALRAASIGMVFQRPSLLSGLTARENVRLMASLAGMEASDAQNQTDSLLDRLGMGALVNRLPHELSGGEEQRVGIARALVHRPVVILADEPTASLDGAAGESIAEILASLAAERHTAVLVATHDLRLRRFASRCLRLVDGVLSEEKDVPRVTG